MQKKLSRSVRKAIRRGKALIRRGVFDIIKERELINDLYKKYENKRNI